MDSTEITTASENTKPEKRGWSFQRYMILAAAGLGVIIILPLIIGLVFAVIADPEPTAIRFGMVRDIVIIILALQGVLIVVALTLLLLQVTRLIAMLQNEIKPILEDTKDTVQTAKGTAEFVGKNVTEPIVTIGAFVTGSTVFIREIFGIRRALKSSKKNNVEKELSDHVE